jgi:hypothetical protein
MCSSINEILLNLIPSDLIKNVLQFACPFSNKELIEMKSKIHSKYCNCGDVWENCCNNIMNYDDNTYPLDKNGNYYWFH